MPHDEFGREVPDPRPVEWPLGLRAPLSIQDEIKRFVRIEMAQRAQEHGFESFEEADDFEVGDDDELVSPYELREMQEDAPLPAKQEFQASSSETKSVEKSSVSTTAGQDAPGGATPPPGAPAAVQAQ